MPRLLDHAAGLLEQRTYGFSRLDAEQAMPNVSVRKSGATVQEVW